MGISQERKDEVQRLREDKKINPDFAPGQGDSDMENNQKPSPFGQKPSPFGQQNTQNQNQQSPFGQKPSPFGQQSGQQPQGGSPFGQQGTNNPQGTGSPFGQKPPMSGGFNSTQPNMLPNQGQQLNQQPVSSEEKFEKMLVAGGTASANFFKEFANSLKLSNSLDYKRGLNNTFIASLVVGSLCLVFGIFNHSIFPIAIGGGITAGFSLVGNYFITHSKKYLKDLEEKEGVSISNTDPEPQPIQNSPFNTVKDDTPNIFSDDEEEDDDFDNFDDDFDDSEELFDDEEDDLDLFDDDFDDEEDEPVKDWKSTLPTGGTTSKDSNIIMGDPSKALDKLNEVDSKMVSRQFIYESMSSASQKITPDYKKRVNISENSDKFNTMDAIFSDIFEVLGLDEEDINNLSKYTETLIVDYLEVERSNKKYKIEDFDKELTQILQKGYDGQGGDLRMFSKSEFIGKKMVTKIFKGLTPMISIGDVLINNKDFYLDTDNGIPIIIGINAEGEEVKIDLEDAESIIISGKPRSGKSFTVRQVLSQVLYFNSPDKVHLYMSDVKGAASDYFSFKDSLPHVQKFVSSSMDTMKMLESLVYTEAERRAKKFEDAGVIKIKDYHERYPDRTDMPYIYVVIDEMVGLANDLREKTVSGGKDSPNYINTYFGYLEKLVTQLPAYGIRLLAVPHRVTNKFIPKTASDNMMFKMAVAADEELLKETLNVTQKRFGYKATSKGDLSILTSLVSPDPFYCRSIVPARTTQESDEFFEFQSKFWNKLSRGTSDKEEDKPMPVKEINNFDYTRKTNSTNSSKTKSKGGYKLDLTDTDGNNGIDFDDLF